MCITLSVIHFKVKSLNSSESITFIENFYKEESHKYYIMKDKKHSLQKLHYPTEILGLSERKISEQFSFRTCVKRCLYVNAR